MSYDHFDIHKDSIERYNEYLDNEIKKKVLKTKKGDVILIGTRLGGGKTTLILKNLESFTPSKYLDNKYIFLSATHRQGYDAVDTFKKIMDGDTFSDFELHELKGKSNYCEFKKYIKYVNDYSLSLSDFCETCPLKRGEDGLGKCEFWQRLDFILKTNTSWRGVHSFLGNIVDYVIEQSKERYYDIVIDEIPYNTIFTKIVITSKHLSDAIDYIIQNTKPSEEKKFLKAFLSEMISLFTSTMNMNLNIMNVKKTVSNIYKLIFDNSSISSTIDAYVEGIITKIREKLINIKNDDELKNIPKRIGFLSLLSKLIKKMVDENKDEEFLKYSIERKFNKILKENLVIIHYCDFSIIINDKVRIWILDATTHPSFYQEIYDKDKLIILDNSSIINNTFRVIQSKDGKYGINKLMNSDKTTTKNFEELMKMTIDIIREYDDKKLLICSRKSRGIQEEIYNRLTHVFKEKLIFYHEKSSQKVDNDHIKTCDIAIDYYGGIRGINSYTNYDICILFGGAFPPPEETKRQSVVSGINKDVILKTLREDEMNQTWGRIRPKDKELIFIFSNIELGFKNQYNTFHMYNNEINDFIKNKFLIDKGMLERLKKDKDFIFPILDNKEITKYEKLPYIEHYIERISHDARKKMMKILKVLASNPSGIDHSELSRIVGHKYFKVTVSYLLEKSFIYQRHYYSSFTSKKKTRRYFHVSNNPSNFDVYEIKANNVSIDGEIIDRPLHIMILEVLINQKKNMTKNQIIRFMGYEESEQNLRIFEEMLLYLYKKEKIFIRRLRKHKYYLCI